MGIKNLLTFAFLTATTSAAALMERNVFLEQKQCTECTVVYPAQCIETGIKQVKHDTVKGKPWITGLHAPAGESVLFNEAHTEGYSFTVGANLGIPFTDITFAGTYSKETSKTIGEGTSQTCPGKAKDNWFCALKVTPYFWRTTGILGYYISDDPDKEIVCKFPNKKFECQAPATDQQGLQTADVEVCICPNHDGSKPKGAPKNALFCPKCDR